MILLTHILLALVSLVVAMWTSFFPSATKLRITYLLTLGTITTGAIMAFTNFEGLGKMCITGIIYLGFVVTSTVLARRKLNIS